MSTNASDVEKQIGTAWQGYLLRTGEPRRYNNQIFRAGYLAALERSEDGDRIREIRETLYEVEKYVQTLKNGVPIRVVFAVVKACKLAGHAKYNT